MNQQDKDRLRELAQHAIDCSDDQKAWRRYCLVTELEPAVILSLLAENEELARDAACFRFWVREAAVNPADMAKLIMRCITEQDYRDAIEPLATKADDVIRAAMQPKGD